MDELSKSDRIKLLRESHANLGLPGGQFMERGAKDYIGGWLAWTGTLFFKDAHTPAVREAICACFKEYEAVAKEHLTWLWREAPTDGKDCVAFRDAKPMADLMKQLGEDSQVSFGYTSGKQKADAGEWEFQVTGRRGWQAKMGTWGLSVMRFSMPLLYVEENPLAFQAMFVKFADLLNAVHGYGGLGLVLSLVRRSDNEPAEALISEKYNGYDVGSPVRSMKGAGSGIKTVSWLTAINHVYLRGALKCRAMACTPGSLAAALPRRLRSSLTTTCSSVTASSTARKAAVALPSTPFKPQAAEYRHPAELLSKHDAMWKSVSVCRTTAPILMSAGSSPRRRPPLRPRVVAT